MPPLQQQTIREEFGEYLRENWDDRETLPVADWWLQKIDQILEEERNKWKTAKEE